MTALFIGLGAGAGILQSFQLRHAVLRGERPFGLLLRFGVVSGVLVVGALSGHLLASALGWACGTAVTTLVLAWRWS